MRLGREGPCASRPADTMSSLQLQLVHESEGLSEPILCDPKQTDHICGRVGGGKAAGQLNTARMGHRCWNSGIDCRGAEQVRAGGGKANTDPPSQGDSDRRSVDEYTRLPFRNRTCPASQGIHKSSSRERPQRGRVFCRHDGFGLPGQDGLARDTIHLHRYGGISHD